MNFNQLLGDLNGHARKGNLPFYLLIQLLHKGAITTSIEVSLVSNNKLKHRHRKCYRNLHGQLFKLWHQYRAGEKKASQLLKACSKVLPNHST